MPLNASGPRPETLPLILLPGTLCDERLFAPLQQRLPGIATQVITTVEAETLEQAAAEVLAQTPAQFALLGFSLGGMVAMEAALRAPERIRGLFLLSTTPFPVPRELHGARRDAIALAHQRGPAALLREHLWSAYSGISPHLPTLPLLEAMASRLGPATFGRQTEMALARKDFRPRLREIGCPTCILAGAEDKLCPPAAQRALADGMPHATLTLLPHTGHLALLEVPDEVASAVAAWFHTIQTPPKETE